MREGLYKIAFETEKASKTGVVFMQDGQVWGGDSGLAFFGSYTLTGKHLTATVHTSRHTEGVPSAFGLDVVQVEITGEAGDESAELQGRSPQAPDLSFRARLILLKSAGKRAGESRPSAATRWLLSASPEPD